MRTVECGYALCVTFVPGDRNLIVGLRNGKMLIIDIASGDVLEEIAAHQTELWSVTLLPTLVTSKFYYSIYIMIILFIINIVFF